MHYHLINPFTNLIIIIKENSRLLIQLDQSLRNSISLEISMKKHTWGKLYIVKDLLIALMVGFVLFFSSYSSWWLGGSCLDI